MKTGETRDFTKSFPEDYEDPVLAGKTLKLRVTLSALKEKQLPALDDDLAQDVNEKFMTLDDLKNDIEARLKKDLESRLRGIKMSKLLEKMLEKAEVPVPETMMRLEFDSRLRNMARRLNTSPETLLKLLSVKGQSLEDILEQWRPDVKKALQSRIILETAIKNKGYEVSDEDLEKEYEAMAADGGASLDEIKKYYEQENTREYLREEIKERRLYDAMLGEIKIKKGKKQKYLDLTANNG
jgi:trigger factor